MGNVYWVKNFTVEYGQPQYHVIPRNLVLLLDASTYVEEIVKNVPRIPVHLFNIINFDRLLTASDNLKNLCGNPSNSIILFFLLLSSYLPSLGHHSFNPLLDIVGYVIGMSETGWRKSNSQDVEMQYVEIQNARFVNYSCLNIINGLLSIFLLFGSFECKNDIFLFLSVE